MNASGFRRWNPSGPNYRAVVKRGRVILAAFGLDLLPAREARALLARNPREICLVELSVDLTDDGPEIVVSPLAELPTDAEETLIAWAAVTGYRRVWLPRRAVELTDALQDAVAATVRCPSCGTRWRESGPAFWGGVQARGEFPDRCELCGGQMPQWRIRGGHPAEHRASIELDPEDEDRG